MHRFARDILLSALPPTLAGMDVLDVGCGEGLITRALASRGADALGIDPTVVLIEHARAAERTQPVGARYRQDDGATLSSVADDAAHWITAGLSLNNIADLDSALGSFRRVLKSVGHLAFTVPHPCFDAPRSGSVSIGGTAHRTAGDYFAEGLWRTTDSHSVRRAGNYHRTITTYVNALMSNGFALELLAEPAPDEQVHQSHPHRAGLPPFLLVRAAVA
jgi:SAM-dependent methyltransferase